MNWRWLTTAGDLTYPFYLLHGHIGWFAITLLSKKWELLAAVTLLGAMFSILGLAYLIHRFVERQLGPRIKRAFLSRSTPVGGADRR